MKLKDVYGVYLLFLYLGQVKSSALLITGTDKINPGVTALNFTCSLFSNSSWTKVTFIRLEKSVTSTWKLIATVSKSGVKVTDNVLLQRAKVTGSVAKVSSAHLRLTIIASKTICLDIAYYQCTFVGGITETELTLKHQINIRPEVPPKGIDEIAVTPNAIPGLPQHTYTAGTVVTLTCTGEVGNPAFEHRWCKKELDGLESVMVPSNIIGYTRNDSLNYRPMTCDYQRISERTYKITAKDLKTEIMCETKTTGPCGSGLFTKRVILQTEVPIPKLLLTGTDKITPGLTWVVVNCSLNSTFITSKTRITLEKEKNNSWTSIAYVNKDAVRILSASVDETTSIQGSVAHASTAYLSLTIAAARTKCSDAATYHCIFVDPLIDETVRAEMKIDVVPRSTLDIVVSPNTSSSSIPLHTYVPGTVVTLYCTGDVGNPAVSHRWCKKGVNDKTFVMYPNNEDIHQEVMLEYQSNTCDYRRTSTLQYNITADDTQIVFLCEDKTNTKCGSGLFTKEITLRKVKYATLEMTGTDKVTPGKTKLEFTCTVTSPSSSQSVTSISLQKKEKLYSPNWKSIAEINKYGLIIMDASDAKRIKSYGSTVTVAGANLHIVIEATDTTCSDVVPYQCVLHDDETHSIVKTKMNVTFEVPGPATGIEEIVVNPVSSLSYVPLHMYVPGTLINLICTGDVGNPALSLRWCRKVPNDKDFVALVDNIRQDVILKNQTDACDYRLTSTLMYNFTEADTQTEFMCEVKTNTECGTGLFTKRIALRKVKHATIIMSGSDKITPGETKLEVVCGLNSTSSSKSVTSITLQRNELNKNPNWISIAQVKEDGIHIRSSSFLNRAKVLGSIANASTAYLSLTVEASYTICSDANRYQCVLQDNEIQSTVRAELNVGIKVPPKSVQEIFVKPKRSSSNLPLYTYVPGTVVTLTCTGGVGNPALTHRWCKKGVTEQTFTLYPILEDIKQDVNFEYHSAVCEYQRTSQLTYNVTEQDIQTVFMCEDSTDITCGSGLLTKSVTLRKFKNGYVETTKSVVPTTSVVGGAAGKVSSDEQQLNTLSIVFIAVSSVVFLMCCVYVVWRIIGKRRQNRKGSQKKTSSFQQKAGNGADRESRFGKIDTMVYDYAHQNTTDPNTGIAVIDTSDGYETLGRYMRSPSYDCLENHEGPHTYFVLDSMPDYMPDYVQPLERR